MIERYAGRPVPPDHGSRLRRRGAEHVIGAFSELRAYLPDVFAQAA